MGRQFLFLQGPHGPFFSQLARHLRKQSVTVLKVGFNRADDREWAGAGPYQPFAEPFENWKTWLTSLMSERDVPDVCLYGDTRAHHAKAIEVAHQLGATVHVFEEGYLRPFWVTYERGGSNGHSRLMEIDLNEMRRAFDVENYEQEEAPPHWGAAWRHALHGFRHHFDVLLRNGAYPNFMPHRPTSTWAELGYYAKRMLLLPLLTPECKMREAKLLKGGKTYHLVLLQMAIDASMRDHSPYKSVTLFMEDYLETFAKGGPADHHLVMKSHPFEDGRERLEAAMKRCAARLGVSDRVVFLHGGKLGPLLDRARSAVTVNSTAGQQALWRGLPIAVLDSAVYEKPEFTQKVDLESFFRHPAAPDAAAYRDYRQFLLMSSQVRGSFYTRAGRRNAVEQITPKMLDVLDPYDSAWRQADVLREKANVTHLPIAAKLG